MEENNAFAALRSSTTKPAVRRGPRLVSQAPVGWSKRVSRSFSKKLPEIFQHLLFLGGIFSVTWGGWMIYKPLGPIFAGVSAIGLAFLLSLETDESHT